MKGQTLQEWAGTSRIFALVFTDIVDSTSLAAGLGDERWIELLLKHFARAREGMERYDHHEIKIIGDSFMVIFRTAVEALDFAVSLHNDTGDPRIKIRAGIHVGTARIIGDDIYGNMVNYTKRVESTADNNGVVLSDIAMHQIKDERATRHDRLRFLQKQVAFKGLSSPQTVFTVKSQEKRSDPPRPKADEESIRELSPTEERAARRILDWSQKRFSRIEWKDASFVPVLEYGDQYTHNPITVYCRGKVSRVEIKFGRMKTRNKLSNESRVELLRKLNKISDVYLPRDSIDKFPAIPLSTLSNDESLDKFLNAIDWTIREVKTTHQSRIATPAVKKSAGQQACRVLAISGKGEVLHSTPVRHSRPDLRQEIIGSQRRWLQKQHPSLKSTADVSYKLQWAKGDYWVFDEELQSNNK